MNPPLLTRFDAWLKQVGKSRDGILVVGGALYILGYIVWSINAFVNKLGLLPAFESQYFIAGIVPLVIIFLAVLLIRLSWKKNPHFPSWLNIWKGTWWNTILKLLFPVAVGVLNSKPANFIGSYFTGHRNLVGGILAGIVVVFVILALFSFDPSSDALKLKVEEGAIPKKKLRALARFAILFLVITVLGAGALYFWAGLLYSKLPQPLGGVRPRCAYLDVENNGLSEDTLRAILPSAHPTPFPTPSLAATSTAAPNIVRSEKVDVLFSGSDYILIRVGLGVYEIKRDVIHAIRSCD